MDRKRSYLEIARDILKAAQYGARPTELVYKANLNFNIIKKYLQEMEEAVLIEVEVINHCRSKTRLYTTTERGLDFIKSLNETTAIFMTPPILEMITTQEVPGVSIAKGC